VAFLFMAPKPAVAQSEPILGQLMLVGFNFCPRGWANADGQLLPISSNTALFSLYGTIYGGNGQTTFGLPDLRGRAPISVGQGPGLESYTQGQSGGAESLSVAVANMPSHNHRVQATNSIGNLPGPGTDFLAKTNGTPLLYHNGPPTIMMDPAMIADTGDSEPIAKRSPYLTMRWCVALQGSYPSRP
jgi:microcystin-dependent protein